MSERHFYYGGEQTERGIVYLQWKSWVPFWFRRFAARHLISGQFVSTASSNVIVGQP